MYGSHFFFLPRCGSGALRRVVVCEPGFVRTAVVRGSPARPPAPLLVVGGPGALRNAEPPETPVELVAGLALSPRGELPGAIGAEEGAPARVGLVGDFVLAAFQAAAAAAARRRGRLGRRRFVRCRGDGQGPWRFGFRYRESDHFDAAAVVAVAVAVEQRRSTVEVRVGFIGQQSDFVVSLRL